MQCFPRRAAPRMLVVRTRRAAHLERLCVQLRADPDVPAFRLAPMGD